MSWGGVQYPAPFRHSLRGLLAGVGGIALIGIGDRSFRRRHEVAPLLAKLSRDVVRAPRPSNLLTLDVGRRMAVPVLLPHQLHELRTRDAGIGLDHVEDPQADRRPARRPVLGGTLLRLDAGEQRHIPVLEGGRNDVAVLFHRRRVLAQEGGAVDNRLGALGSGALGRSRDVRDLLALGRHLLDGRTLEGLLLSLNALRLMAVAITILGHSRLLSSPGTPGRACGEPPPQCKPNLAWRASYEQVLFALSYQNN